MTGHSTLPRIGARQPGFGPNAAGWCVAMLLVFAGTGRWLPRGRAVAPPLAPLASLD